MKQYKIGRYIVLAVIGFVIFAAGLILTRLSADLDGILKTFPYICVGIGSGIFGGNLGIAIKNKVALQNPQVAKQMEIEEKDERNRTISDKAKAKTYDLMIFVYAGILLAFALIQVDMYVVLALVAVYLFFIFSNVYYLAKYQKEM
ncbi:hypothetical protein OXPF_14780 [Oxobacter pfennigii]|uniref:DUF2178 domain-containing protein n=1 Tax=Oxobacter pfennigii TaxID=36849 RepID=A0A0N8NTJ4_9CLOT|nr:hypothetical protein [Oxobacter pfennigii]KPU45000.1 hypothetical protein OXPF_14780 [Oxobacter pfennigii]